MLSVDEAFEKVLSGFAPIGCESVALSDGLGRVLAEDVTARLTQPPTDVSAMDGYAVRGADVTEVPVTLTRVGESQAGCGFEGTVSAGETVRIFTGAPLPEGANTIVIQEVTEADGDQVLIKESAPFGDFVRPAGLDFRAGEVLLKAGKVLSARDIGLCASMNVPWLTVRRKPRVAILATGDEVVMPGDPMGPDQIISSNSLALAAYVDVMGGLPVNLGIARDTMESLRETLAGAKGADLLVTIGGASVGEYDLVQKVMGEEGLELNFYKVAMRPGKPLIFGHLGDIPVLGLPGNPVSVGVTSALFLQATMDVMLGIERIGRALETARLGRDLPKNGPRQDYMRAQLITGEDGELTALPFDGQDSSMMARFAKADCLVIRAPHAEPASVGQRVEILRMRGGRAGF